MSFTKRGSWGTKSSAFRINHGRWYRPTCVTIGGVNTRLRTGGGHSRGRRPTRAEQVAQVWELKSGLHYVRMRINNEETTNVLVDGAELTWDRFNRVITAGQGRNVDAHSRLAKSFIRAWDFLDNDRKPLPISKASIESLTPGIMLGFTTDIARVLDMPKTEFGPAVTY